MQVKYAICSANNDPTFIDFWPIFARVWSELCEVVPVLVYVNDDGAELDETCGTVIRLEPTRFPDVLEALWGRYWATQLFPDDVCILTDIDMLPAQRDYFIDSLKDYGEDDYLHLTPLFQKRPTCYHVAKGFRYREVLALEDRFDDSMQTVMDYHKTTGIEHRRHSCWTADEEYARHRLRACRDQIKNRKREWKDSDGVRTRIDRARWEYNLQFLRQGRYIDAHLQRPYSEHKEDIDCFVEDVLSTQHKGRDDAFGNPTPDWQWEYHECVYPVLLDDHPRLKEFLAQPIPRKMAAAISELVEDDTLPPLETKYAELRRKGFVTRYKNEEKLQGSVERLVKLIRSLKRRGMKDRPPSSHQRWHIYPSRWYGPVSFTVEKNGSLRLIDGMHRTIVTSLLNLPLIAHLVALHPSHGGVLLEEYQACVTESSLCREVVLPG